ncbi:peroxide stress protein YaaA [Alloiococcus sp. CFN-8]|uniref:peroxide stress protein YaaA n=1 Tax=Alloiococcus sp. CFN-8 TaxID=3416081 RepID=UPI003CF57433
MSPAKTLNFDSICGKYQLEEPRFLKEAARIAEEMKKRSPEELESLMKISPKLGEMNYKRFKEWSVNKRMGKPALLAFQGDVYRAMKAEDFTEEQLEFTNNHLRILSGLYGVIKPMDDIQPYRLEMGTPLSFRGSKNLYDYWSGKLTKYFKEELSKEANGALINLASIEYSKAIDLQEIKKKYPVINISFKEYKNGKHQTIGIYSKRARGYMSKFIMENAIDNPEDIKEFSLEGYGFNSHMSSEEEYVFVANR